MFSISVIIPTRERPRDLADLLLTILNQSLSPIEVIIVDDSLNDSTISIFHTFSSKFESINCSLKYIKASGDGLTAARNLGLCLAGGDVILFLDDDTQLDTNVLFALVTFLRENPAALGIQPRIISAPSKIAETLSGKIENAVCKVAMLSYNDTNKLVVRRSGASIFPSYQNKVIRAQRLSGCCFCFKREVFSKFSFDTHLQRSGSMEDMDFSYRVFKLYPHSLYVLPHSKIIHKKSEKARLPTKLEVYMTTTYWFYVFFKDVFEGSIMNLTAFAWALIGNLGYNLGGLIIKRKSKSEWWRLIYLLGSYASALRNLKNIRMLKLEFFNKNLAM